MPTDTLTLFNSFLEYEAEKVINMESDTFKVMLTNSAPVVTNTVKADITEIGAGNGYTAGGATITVTSSSQTSGVYKWVIADVTFTATGSVGPFQYAVIYDDTPSSPLDPLVGFLNYGSPVTLSNGQQLLLDFDGSTGVAQKTKTP